MVTWFYSFYLLLAIIYCWYITGLSIKVTLQIRPLLHLGPNVITDKTFIMLGFKILLRMEILLRLGPNVIKDGTFITLGSSYYTCAFYSEACSSAIFYFQIITFIRPCNTRNKLRCVSNLRIDFLVNFLVLFPPVVLSKLYPRSFVHKGSHMTASCKVPSMASLWTANWLLLCLLGF